MNESLGKQCAWCGSALVIQPYEINRPELFARRRFCGSKKCSSSHHGEGANLGRSPEYRAWDKMIQRCCNPKSNSYLRYGARGIYVCEEWRRSFKSFLDHVGRKPTPEHSLDRIDNDGPYEPGNVRWSTRKEQCRNMRTNRFITIDGEQKTLAEWKERSGLSGPVILHRINHQWPEHLLLVRPQARGRKAKTNENR